MHPEVLLPAISSGTATVLALYLAFRPGSDRRWLVIGLLVATALWCGGITALRASMAMPLSIPALTTVLIGAHAYGPLWLLVAARDSRVRAFEQSPALALAITAPSGLGLLAFFTNSGHRLFLKDLSFPAQTVLPDYGGPLLLASAAWLVVLTAAGSWFYLRSSARMLRNRDYARALALSTAVLATPVTLVAFIFRLLPTHHDLTPTSLALTTLLLFWVYWNRNAQGTLPLARRDVIEQLSEGVVVVDSSGIVIDFNPALPRVLGTSAEALRGNPISRILEEIAYVDPARIENCLRLVLSGVPVPLGEIKTRDDRVIECSCRPVLGDDGEPVALFGVLRDCTEKRRYEMFLRRSQRLETVAELGAGIAHEVNNPLSFVHSNLSHVHRMMTHLGEEFAELTGRKSEDIDELRLVIEESQEGVDRISRIIERMRRFSRMQEGEVGPVDLNRVVTDAVKMAGLHRGPHVDLQLQLADSLPTIQGSEERLGQAILNLVVNARQAVADDATGVVEIRTLDCESAVEVQVTDNGAGIPAEILERVFDPFFTTKAPGEGTGLGLAISYDIVRDHGGVLELQSPTDGGCHCVMRLPVPAAVD